VRDEDAVDLPSNDFRRPRRYLAPWVFALPGGEEGKTYPPASDLVGKEHWDGIMDLPTDVALKSSSFEGSKISRLYELHTDWVFSWPKVGTAPFIEDAALLAGEEFDALVFNALHGWYRQAIGCLRNALETMIVAAALAATGNRTAHDEWRAGTKEFGFGTARALLRDSPLGQQVDLDASRTSVFGDDPASWAKARYSRLCAYAHSRAGATNADFWQSNGPIFVPSALNCVEDELRNTLALCYLLLRLGWPGYKPGRGAAALLDGPPGEWAGFETLLRKWLLTGI
jgi:hypothetical protein